MPRLTTSVRQTLIAVLGIILAAGLLLAGCANAPAAAPATSEAPGPRSAAPVTPNAKPTPRLIDLPTSPPLEVWVQKGSDFQRTLDLRMETAMVSRLYLPMSYANEDAARRLAYYMCTEMRRGRPGGEALADVYTPRPDPSQQISVTLEARAYCLDA